MSQSEKAAYYQALKRAGVDFTKHYREYSTAELKAGYNKLVAEGVELPPVLSEPPVAAEPAPLPLPPTPPPVPVAERNPEELAGQRLNAKDEDEPIRTDENGNIWFQEEVLKPAYPKARGRRVLKYMDPGVEEQTVKNGDYVETFEVSGDPANAKPAEVKITLPSYQVGIYKDPRLPFRIHTYGGNNGFNLQEVQAFYGGPEMVPVEIKRVYIENVLCYDIRTTVQAIQAEYRQQQLVGQIR